MGQNVEVIFDYERDGEQRFRMKIDGVPYEKLIEVQHPEIMKLEGDMTATARRFGSFLFIRASQDFASTRNTTPEGVARFVAALRAQGHRVTTAGAFDAGSGRCYPAPAAITKMPQSEIELPPATRLELTASERIQLQARQAADRAARSARGHSVSAFA